MPFLNEFAPSVWLLGQVCHLYSMRLQVKDMYYNCRQVHPPTTSDQQVNKYDEVTGFRE